MLKQKTKIRLGLVSFAAVLITVSCYFLPVSADTGNTNFEVNVQESLAVTITTPSSGATGNIGDFLRNEVVVSVFSNSSSGCTSSMKVNGSSTALAHASKENTTIPTLSSISTRENFPANYWGYSLDDTTAGSTSSTYSAMQTTDIPLPNITWAAGTTGSNTQNIYFGAKADISKPSGTYTGTVVISVVTGADSTTPATDNDTSGTNPTYDNTVYTSDTPSGRTVYTTTSSDSQAGTDTTTTIVSKGDTRATYANPQGVNTVSNISSGSGLATGLAVTASIAAASGIFFFILAKRDDDDDEEEEEGA